VPQGRSSGKKRGGAICIKTGKRKGAEERRVLAGPFKVSFFNLNRRHTCPKEDECGRGFWGKRGLKGRAFQKGGGSLLPLGAHAKKPPDLQALGKGTRAKESSGGFLRVQSTRRKKRRGEGSGVCSRMQDVKQGRGLYRRGASALAAEGIWRKKEESGEPM